MLTKYERLQLLEKDVERLEGNIEYLIDTVQKLKDNQCACGGQSCGPTYSKPVGEDK